MSCRRFGSLDLQTRSLVLWPASKRRCTARQAGWRPARGDQVDADIDVGPPSVRGLRSQGSCAPAVARLVKLEAFQPHTPNHGAAASPDGISYELVQAIPPESADDLSFSL